MTSLYSRLGGQEAVDAVIETFYRKVLSDDRISKFFDDVDMDKQMLKQKSFLTMVFGGPVKYSGKDMRDGHKHLVAQGLQDTHVDAVIELLGAALQEHLVKKEDITEIAQIANSVRDDVLNRGPL
jgi:hemoglobin